MSRSKGLWLKEIMMMRGFHIFLLVIYGVLSIITLSNEHTIFLSTEYMIGQSIMGLMIIPCTMLFSLNMEKHQMTLFLFQKGNLKKQIQMKWLHAFLLYSLFFIWLSLLSIVSIMLDFSDSTLVSLMAIIWYLFFYMLSIQMIATVAIFIAWVIHQWIRNKVGFLLSVIVMVITFVVFFEFFQRIFDIPIIQNIWTIEIQSEQMPLQLFITDGYLSMSMIIFTGAILYLFYWLSLQLFIKKVEV